MTARLCCGRMQAVGRLRRSLSRHGHRDPIGTFEDDDPVFCRRDTSIFARLEPR